MSFVLNNMIYQKNNSLYCHNAMKNCKFADESMFKNIYSFKKV